MQLQAQLNFILSDELSDVFLMSGDYEWLNENVFHDGEFYVGMHFNHLGSKYKIISVRSFEPSSDTIEWSSSKIEFYFGKECVSNFDVYLKCQKIS